MELLFLTQRVLNSTASLNDMMNKKAVLNSIAFFYAAP